MIELSICSWGFPRRFPQILMWFHSDQKARGWVETFGKWGADTCRSCDQKCLFVCRSKLKAFPQFFFQSNSRHIKICWTFPMLLLLLGMFRTQKISAAIAWHTFTPHVQSAIFLSPEGWLNLGYFHKMSHSRFPTGFQTLVQIINTPNFSSTEYHWFFD